MNLFFVVFTLIFGAKMSTALICHKCEETTVGGSVQSDDNCDRNNWGTSRCFDGQVCIYSNITGKSPLLYREKRNKSIWHSIVLITFMSELSFFFCFLLSFSGHS